MPGEVGCTSFQARRHFNLRMSGAVSFGNDAVPVTTNQATRLAINEQGGDSLTAEGLPAGSTCPICARRQVYITKSDVTNIEHNYSARLVENNVLWSKTVPDKRGCTILIVVIVFNDTVARLNKVTLRESFIINVRFLEM